MTKQDIYDIIYEHLVHREGVGAKKGYLEHKEASKVAQTLSGVIASPQLKPNKNSQLLQDFVIYCDEHPDERFWQALRNWAEVPRILVGLRDGSTEDTFYFEGKQK